MVVALAFLIGVVFGRGGAGQQGEEVAEKQEEVAETTEKTSGAKDTEQKAETTPSEKSAPLGAVVGQGETANFPDRTVTVNDIQSGYIFPSNIPRARPGNEFVIANVTITNTSSQPIQVNSFNFESEDSGGARLKAQPTNAPPEAINVASVAPNGELTGNLVFEVQQGDPNIKIVHRPR